jgi:hypothetical protein
LTTSDMVDGGAYDSELVTKLHIQVMVVPNVCQLVNIVLDTTSSNYAIWHNLHFCLESGSTVSTIRSQLPPAGSSTTAACQPAMVVPTCFEPLVAPLPAPAVPLGFLPHAASVTLVVPHVAQASFPTPCVITLTPAVPCAAPESPAATDGPPPHEWPSSPIVYTCTTPPASKP